MALNKVSQRVTTAVYARLSSNTTGVNPGFVANAPNYGIPTTYLNIDWSATSKNFFLGQWSPDMFEQTSICTYPLTCLYILQSRQTGEQRFNQFSGNIQCVFDMWLSWKQITGRIPFENYVNCIEDVVIDVMNRVENQNWGKPLVYNGNIECRRGPLQFAAENFRQRLGFSMLFQVHE